MLKHLRFYKHSKAEWLLALVAFCVGYGLRIFRLDAKDIWWDEAHSWWYASMPLFEGIRLGMAEWTGAVGDPFYPILLSIWLQATGESVFTMRYLSLLLSMLSVAFAARLGLVAFKRPVWLAGLWITSTSAILIFYSQEVRQYTLTPLIMLTMLLMVVRIQQTDGRSIWAWFGLAAAEALGLYTHSFMAFGIVGVNVWLGLIWLRHLRQPAVDSSYWFGVWMFSQVVALLAIGPALPNYIARTAAGGSVFVQLELPFIINAVWSLLLGIPWEHATDPLLVRVWAGLFMLSFMVGIMLARLGRVDVDLMLVVFVTMALAFAYWWLTPIIHPRYLLFLSGPLFVVIAALIVRLWRYSVLLSGLLIGSWGLVTMFNLGNLYTGRHFGYRHDPSQQVVQAAANNTDGVISVDPYDFSLRYYGLSEPDFLAAGLDEGLNTPDDIAAFLDNRERVDVIRFHAERSDVRGVIPYALEQHGQLEHVTAFESYQIFTYAIDDHIPSPRQGDVNYLWPQMQLIGYQLDAGNTVTLVLDWVGTSPTQNYSAVVRVYDAETNWLLAEVGKPIFNARRAPTSEWVGHEQARQYFNIPLPAGMPQIPVEVEITLVETATAQPIGLTSEPGQRVELPEQVIIGVVDSASPYAARQVVQPVAEAIISGYMLDAQPVPQGGRTYITLRWEEPPNVVADANAEIVLRQGNTIIARTASEPLDGREPAPTEPWLDRRLMIIDEAAAAGDAELTVQYGAESVDIGQIEISDFARVFIAPEYAQSVDVRFGDAVTLIGATIDATEEQASVRLVWRGGAEAQMMDDQSVFVHLVEADTGVIITQHDGMPVYGQRPTSTWAEGEYIIDEHPLNVDVTRLENAEIRVGLYDPQTFIRIQTDTRNDSVTLILE